MDKDLIDEKIVTRALMIADYMINEYENCIRDGYGKDKYPTIRKVAEYFSDNHFQVSKSTVHDYLSKRLMYIDLEKYQIVREILDGNRPTIALERIKKRVLEAAQLLIEGNTIEQIAGKYNVHFLVIERDLKQRLPKIGVDQEYIDLINEILSKNARSGLKQNRK